MFDFYEKRRLRTILYSKPILVVLVLLVFAMLYAVWGAYQKEVETRERWDQRAEVLSELEARESQLQTEIERLETKRGVEAEIRSKFEVAKEGEEVIVIVEPPDEENDLLPLEEEPGFFERILNFFN